MKRQPRLVKHLNASIGNNQNLNQTHEWRLIHKIDTVFRSTNAAFDLVPDEIGKYHIEYESTFEKNGCSNYRLDTNGFRVIMPTLLISQQKEFNIFPIPFTQQFELQGIKHIKSCHLISLKGKEIQIEFFKTGNKNWNIKLVNRASPGIYLFTIITNDSLHSIRLISR
ncbi:MAG: T9SS type A sorting domain-containing protein [Bacteroidia bacterium]